MNNKPEDHKNIIYTIVISIIIIIMWNFFYERPKMQEYERNLEKNSQIDNNNQINNDGNNYIETAKDSNNKLQIYDSTNIGNNIKGQDIYIDRDKILEESKENRIYIENDFISGSINIKSLQIDNIILKDYKESIDDESNNIKLLSPVKSKNRYFIDFGFISSNKNLDLPNKNTIWNIDKNIQDSQNKTQTILLSYLSEDNILFKVNIIIDNNYLFDIKLTAINNSNQDVTIKSYSRINRLMAELPKKNFISHEGIIMEFDDSLQEITYNDLLKKEYNFDYEKGWVALSDKYWLSAIINDKNYNYETKLTYKNENNYYQINIENLTEEFILRSEDEFILNHKLFIGAKELKLLDKYKKEYDINLFDRVVDFGWYYFLTKPFYSILKFFGSIFNNYGLAIIFTTLLIKIILFPLANKSYISIAKLKKLAPEIEKIKEKNKDNKMQISKEMMALYKEKSVNPASGCLPILLQIPIFFSLYKVLFVSLDMRHAEFIFWIKDLSAKDPLSIFNLFGLLPFETGSIFDIGILAIIMGITMLVQQRMGNMPSDPMQARIMKWMPIFFIFLFASFPSGLLIYWIFNNILSIMQQYIISKKYQ